MKNKLTDKQQKWVDRIHEQRELGIGKQEYCKRNGLNTHQFSYYHRFLRDTQKNRPGFVALKSKSSNLPIILTLTTGLRIEIPECHIDKLASIASQF
jgi:hypothetical protein